MSKFEYDKEIAQNVVYRLKNSEDALNKIIDIVERFDNIKDNSQTCGLLEDIDFYDLKDKIQRFKESNIMNFYQQIQQNSDIVEETDVSISRQLEGKDE